MHNIRTATIEDAGAIARVHVQSWRTTYSGIVPEETLAQLNEEQRELAWREWLAQDVAVFVAEYDGEIAGFASAGPIREPVAGFDAELYAIYLLERAQGRGIGTALLRRSSAALLAQGCNSMVAWVLSGNRSTAFYERWGAGRVGSKEIERAGVSLPVIAYGWPSLDRLR